MRNWERSTVAVLAALSLAACGDQITQPEVRAPEGGARRYVLPTGVSATMAPGGPYNLRAGPGTGFAVEGSVAGGASVKITCTSRGESVSGHYGTSRVWDKLGNGSWVADANVYTGTDRQAARPCTRDDYPYKTSSTSGVDAWNFYNRQCTSFAAFRINWNGTRTGRTFTNMYLGEHFGDAHMWDDAARASGVAVYQSPAVGRIAQWNRNVGGVGGWGHVAYVAAVYADGSILVEEYNWIAYDYGTRRIYPGGGYWPSNFIDF
jgi:surface antigen